MECITKFFKKQGLYGNAAILLMVSAFIYACIRSSLLSITHDEALTYFISIKPIVEILANNVLYPANNHFLNTLLIKFFTSVFGLSEFVVRIPALIGFGIYLSASYLLLRLFLRRIWLVLGSALMVLNPFMLDFFSCARGYSLALGFFMLALYVMFSISVDGLNTKRFIYLLLFMFLCIASSLTFIIPFFAMLFIVFVIDLKSWMSLRGKKDVSCNREHIYVRVFTIFITGFILFNIVAMQFAKLENVHLHFLGGHEGLWYDTVGSLIKASLYGMEYASAITPFVFAFVIAVLLISVFVIVFRTIKSRRLTPIDFYIILSFSMIGLCSLAYLFVNFTLGTAFPRERTVLFMIPLFTLLWLLVWSRLKTLKAYKVKHIINVFMVVVAVIIILHYMCCVNLTHFHNWKNDASTKDVMYYIYTATAGESIEEKSMSVGITQFFEPSVNFYITKYDMYGFKEVDRKGFDAKSEFYYVCWTEKNLLEPYNLEVIKSYDLSETYLAVHK